MVVGSIVRGNHNNCLVDLECVVTTHNVIAHIAANRYSGEPFKVKTLHRSGLYAVADLNTDWCRFIVTHTPTGLTVASGKDLSQAIKIANALDHAFKSTGKGVRWGDSQTLTMELNSVNDIVKVCASARETNE